jgi:hypothetical protein
MCGITAGVSVAWVRLDEADSGALLSTTRRAFFYGLSRMPWARNVACSLSTSASAPRGV